MNFNVLSHILSIFLLPSSYQLSKSEQHDQKYEKKNPAKKKINYTVKNAVRYYTEIWSLVAMLTTSVGCVVDCTIADTMSGREIF